MRNLLIIALDILVSIAIALIWGCSTPNSDTATEQAPVTPAETVSESADDWEVLFDGENLDHWHDYQGEGISWKMENGTLTTEGGKGDIVSDDTYKNFELEFEWKVAEAGNSGVIYLVQENEQYEHSFETGPEYQIIDADNFTKKNDYPLEESQKTGANYAMHAAEGAEMKPINAFNQGKLIVNDGHVEHWLNGKKVVEYDLWTDAWKEQVAQTKFKDMPGYGQAKEGHIALQDHGDRVWFRNVRIRRL